MLVLTAGLLAATFGYGASVVRAFVIDSGATVDAASAALRDDAARALVVRRTADAVADQLVGEAATRDLAAFGIDVRRDLGPIAASLVQTPEFESAFAIAVQKLHDRVFIATTVTPTIDLSALAARARLEAIAINPAYRQLILPNATLVVELPVAALPDLSSLDRTLSASRVVIAFAASAMLVLAAALLATERSRVMRRCAVWLLSLGGLQLGLCIVAQLALGRLEGEAAPILRASGRAVLPQLARPALAPMVLGLFALLVSLVMRRAGRGRFAAHGRAAFLTDEHGRHTEWCFDAPFEPEVLRTAPGTITYRR